ncbi:MAG: outer membrane protein assembly factor BamA [Proteobacteria bacterium]|nr:outer membrane protein assembly factor BamA [Pseudomonadota bacterium]
MVTWASSLWADNVREIRIQGNQRIESETILSYVPIKIGDEFDVQKVDSALKDLYATGYFIDVQVERQGEALVIKVEENALINKIAFEGNSKLKDDKLQEEVQLRGSEVLSRNKVQTAQQRILEIYRRLGMFGATVEPKIIRLSDNRVDLVFEINEGSVTYVRRIHFIGNKQFSHSKLESVLMTKRTRWYNFFATNDVYDPDRLIVDQQNLRQFYYDHGYPDFRIISAVAELSPDHKDFYITFTVEEGVSYTFGKIDLISKIASIPAEELKGYILIKEGEVFSGKMVDKTINTITDALGVKGYAFAQVEPVVNKDREKRTVEITFEIKEGPRVYVERIDVVGNDRTRDEVIRREIALHEGDAYNSAKIKKSEKNLKDLGYFKNVSIEAEQGSTPDKAKLLVKVEEQPTGELGIAGGYSTLDGPLGNIKFVEKNFMGKGQIIHSDLTIAKKRQDFDIGFIEPYLFGRNLQGSVDLFSVRSARFSTYTHLSKGAQLGLGYYLTENLSQMLTYGIRDDQIKSVSANASQFIKEQAGNFLTSSIGQTLAYDKRDSKIDPTSGYIVSLNNTYAGLGGNVTYLRNSLGGTVYYSPLEEVVCALRGIIGTIERTGKTIRIVDSYMLGLDSFRGFEYGGIGPRDSNTGDSLGGTRYWTGTAEVLFPIGLPNEFGVKGAAFTDFGAVWKPGKTGPQVKDKSTLRASVGLGLSWTSPFGPLRIDYAIPVKKERFDKEQRFLFGFSTRF